jgi:hypothetical protein
LVYSAQTLREVGGKVGGGQHDGALKALPFTINLDLHQIASSAIFVVSAAALVIPSLCIYEVNTSDVMSGADYAGG